MDCRGLRNGQRMNVVAAAFANYIGEGMTPDQLAFMSSFLQTVGEALDVIAAAEQLCGNGEK